MWSRAPFGTIVLQFWRPKLLRKRLVLLHRRLVVASGALWNVMFQWICWTAAVIGRCVASYVIKFERLALHFAMLSLLAMPLSAFLHEIHNVVVTPTPLLTLCYVWRVGFVEASVNM